MPTGCQVKKYPWGICIMISNMKKLVVVILIISSFQNNYKQNINNLFFLNHFRISCWPVAPSLSNILVRLSHKQGLSPTNYYINLKIRKLILIHDYHLIHRPHLTVMFLLSPSLWNSSLVIPYFLWPWHKLVFCGLSLSLGLPHD